MFSLDLQGAMESFASTNVREELGGALVLLLALFVVGFLPTSTFMLKRHLFNLYPGAKERLDSIAGRDHIFSVEGLYTLEYRIFGEFGSRRPKEFPFDLLLRVRVRALLVPPLIGFIGLLALVPAVAPSERYWLGALWAAICALLATSSLSSLSFALDGFLSLGGNGTVPVSCHRLTIVILHFIMERRTLKGIKQRAAECTHLRERGWNRST
jgi:hypothetical protein